VGEGANRTRIDIKPPRFVPPHPNPLPKGEREKEDDLLPYGRGRKDEGLQFPITSS